MDIIVPPSTTDKAIQECDGMISAHRRASSRIIAIGATLFLMLIFIGVLIVQGVNILAQRSVALEATEALYLKPAANDQKQRASSEITAISTQLSSSILWGAFAIFIIVFSVLISIYRFHLNEISKAEHYKLGFMRIRIAASNSGTEYQTEVRKALTDSAFAYEKPAHGLFKNKHVESPLPGHPTSDVATHLLDKILDKFELVQRKKASSSKEAA